MRGDTNSPRYFCKAGERYRQHNYGQNGKIMADQRECEIVEHEKI